MGRIWAEGQGNKTNRRLEAVTEVFRASKGVGYELMKTGAAAATALRVITLLLVNFSSAPSYVVIVIGLRPFRARSLARLVA